MRRNALLILAGVIAFGTPAVLTSQLAAASAGSRVRVKAPTVQKRRIVGTLLSPITDSVKIEVYMGRAADARRHTIPVSSIETLEVSLGRSRAAGAKRGVKVVALGAGAFWIGCSLVEKSAHLGQDVAICALLAGILSLPFMVVGAVVGSIVRKEKWRSQYPVSQ